MSARSWTSLILGTLKVSQRNFNHKSSLPVNGCESEYSVNRVKISSIVFRWVLLRCFRG